MKIELRVDPDCKETKVIVCTSEVTEEIRAMVDGLSQQAPRILAGFREDEAMILPEEEIFRVYSENGKVCAETQRGTFVLRLRLYELEERLDPKKFVRISNSEIVNLRRVSGFDLSFAGTICVKMQNGALTYVSRRYVAKIKQMLGL